MKQEVIRVLSEYLDALAYQVEAWDQKVIDSLASNTRLFEAFRSGCDRTKWDIYLFVKYAKGNTPV